MITKKKKKIVLQSSQESEGLDSGKNLRGSSEEETTVKQGGRLGRMDRESETGRGGGPP